jgi:hypothetical protein
MNKLDKYTDGMIETLRNSYAKIDGIDPCSPSYRRLTKMLDDMPPELIDQLANVQPPIKFISSLARNRVMRRCVKAHEDLGGRTVRL